MVNSLTIEPWALEHQVSKGAKSKVLQLFTSLWLKQIRQAALETKPAPHDKKQLARAGSSWQHTDTTNPGITYQIRGFTMHHPRHQIVLATRLLMTTSSLTLFRDSVIPLLILF